MILKLFYVAHSTRVSPLSCRWPRPNHAVALCDVFVCPPTCALKSPSQLCSVFAFTASYQWCCRSCLSLHLNEMSLSHILERSAVGICLLCVGPVMLLWNSQRILLLCCLFKLLFTRKHPPACPLLTSEWYSRWPLWRVVKLSSFLRTSPSPITSHFMLFSFSSSSSSGTCSSFSNVLTLYVAINLQSLSPCVMVLLVPEILSTPCM